jgi:DNA-directed RNA polymerase subunit beta'
VLAEDDVMLDDSQIKAIIKAGITTLHVRSILRCRSRHGVCVHCYGSDLASGLPVNIGEAVGIIAAQSIGEPGTQLTMRTFHTGGAAGGGADITQGLPRVEELFEARRPKKLATMAEISGVVRIKQNDTKNNRIVTVHNMDEERQYTVAKGIRILVEDGQEVEKGVMLTEGSMSPTDITRIIGLDAVYDFLIKEIQRVYRLQSVEINDKHVEVIARQMTRKARIEDAGSSELLLSALVDVLEIENENERIMDRTRAGEAGLRPVVASPVLLGITKASLSTDSWLSAASFQETTKVLTEAAIKGKVDPLLGLKENVIIGKLIPAGTGMQQYRDLEVQAKMDDNVTARPQRTVSLESQYASYYEDNDEVITDDELFDSEEDGGDGEEE